MKIAVLTSSYPRFRGDGTAPFIKAFCEGLAKLGHDISVSAPFDPEIKPEDGNKVPVDRFKYIWPEKWHIMGHARSLRADVRIHPIAYLLLPLYILGSVISLNRIVNRQRSDLIHVHWVLPNGVAAMVVSVLRRIPFVVSLHGSDMYLARRNIFFGSIARMIFRRADGVTACSPELLGSALEMGAPEHSILLPYGVDPNKFHPHKPNSPAPKFKGDGDDKVLLLALGRLVYKKGFNILIDATSHVVEMAPNVKVIIAGEGPIFDELFEQINSLEMGSYIELYGSIPWDEIPDFLTSGDIFVLPSIRDKYGNIDGLPNVLLEAMSSGKPVIASDIPGVKVVIEDGRTGVLVPAGDKAELSQAIINLVGNPSLRKKLGDEARVSIKERFTWQTTLNKLTGYFDRIVNKD